MRIDPENEATGAILREWGDLTAGCWRVIRASVVVVRAKVSEGERPRPERPRLESYLLWATMRAAHRPAFLVTKLGRRRNPCPHDDDDAGADPFPVLKRLDLQS